MTHDEMAKIDKKAKEFNDTIQEELNPVVGTDAIILRGKYAGRKGRVTSAYATPFGKWNVLLVVPPYKIVNQVETSDLLHNSAAHRPHVMSELLLCDDKARYAKYLLTL